MSRREYDALKAIYDESRKPMFQMYAEIRAEMRNLHAPRKGQPWIADDFLGGRKPQSIEQKKNALAALFAGAKRKAGEVFTDKNDPITKVG